MSALRRTIRRRVRRGSRFLEAQAPYVPAVAAFRQRILEHIEETEEALAMAEGSACVLGKLFGSYEHGVEALNLITDFTDDTARQTRLAVGYGFLAPHLLRYDAPETKLDEYYSILTEEWMKEISLQ